MDENLELICRKKENVTRVGFSSAEFQNVGASGNFKSSVDQMAIHRIKEDIEGRCKGDGYVLPNSVILKERSAISFPHEALQLYYSMRVSYEYMICNPNPGVVLECKVVTRNKIGLLCRLESEQSPLIILVPCDLCDTKEKMLIMETTVANSKINVVIVGKKFEQNDKKITVIAEIVA